MTIYVDTIRHYPSGPWCHMATDGPIEELQHFAQRIGLSRSRLQHHRLVPHYDLGPIGRERAVALGAIEVPSKELLRRSRQDRGSLASSSNRQKIRGGSMPSQLGADPVATGRPDPAGQRLS